MDDVNEDDKVDGDDHDNDFDADVQPSEKDTFVIIHDNSQMDTMMKSVFAKTKSCFVDLRYFEQNVYFSGPFWELFWTFNHFIFEDKMRTISVRCGVHMDQVRNCGPFCKRCEIRF